MMKSSATAASAKISARFTMVTRNGLSNSAANAGTSASPISSTAVATVARLKPKSRAMHPPEQPLRPYRQHGGHHQIDQHRGQRGAQVAGGGRWQPEGGQRRQVDPPQGIGHADQQRAGDRALDGADAADD